MKRTILALILGWYVTTYTGQTVAGPFTSNSACVAQANAMIRAGYSNISTICRYYN